MSAAKSQEAILDVEKLARQVAALVVLREKSVIVGDYYVNEALWGLLEKVYKIDEKIERAVEGIDSGFIRDAVKARLEREIYEHVLDALSKYRVYTDEETNGDVYVFADYDITRDVNNEILYLIYFYEAEAVIEEYLRKKLSTRGEEWSAAREALKLARAAGFKIDEHVVDNTKIQYKIAAPTNEEFTIWMVIEGSKAYYSFDEP
ncbi:hypothetical protein [Pyrobaculum sp.]|uniref:hypothetical protein n=1 Tax=Pyrobaculum sp. TaxID=2004705 RepID=UPI003D0A104C